MVRKGSALDPPKVLFQKFLGNPQNLLEKVLGTSFINW